MILTLLLIQLILKRSLYLNTEGNVEDYVGYLDQKNKHPVTTGQQRRRNFITGRISCLVPNTKSTEPGNIEDNFDLKTPFWW